MSLMKLLAQQIKIPINSDRVDVVFVGDTHFNYVTPRSRLDDYPETCVKKLDMLRLMCKERGFKYIIFLGDIFHKPKQPVDYLVKIMIALKRFQEDGITCYTIVGNHCIYQERLDSLERTALGLMFEANVLTPFHTLSFQMANKKTLNVYGYHYSEPPKPLMENDSSDCPIGDYNIMAAHMFYEFDLSTGTDNLKEKDIINLGYDMYALGHDHVAYDNETVGSSVIIRPGSFMRGTGHKYNLTRDVYVDVVRVNSHTVVERVTLPVQSADTVFSAVVTDKVNLKTLTEDLKSQFNSLITMLEAPKSEGVTVYKIMDEMVIQPKVKARIEQYLEDYGVFRPPVTEADSSV